MPGCRRAPDAVLGDVQLRRVSALEPTAIDQGVIPSAALDLRPPWPTLAEAAAAEAERLLNTAKRALRAARKAEPAAAGMRAPPRGGVGACLDVGELTPTSSRRHDPLPARPGGRAADTVLR